MSINAATNAGCSLEYKIWAKSIVTPILSKFMSLIANNVVPKLDSNE